MDIDKQMVLVPQHVFLELFIQSPDFRSLNLHYACVIHGDVYVSLVWSHILVEYFSPVSWKCNKMTKRDVTQLDFPLLDSSLQLCKHCAIHYLKMGLSADVNKKSHKPSRSKWVKGFRYHAIR